MNNSRLHQANKIDFVSTLFLNKTIQSCRQLDLQCHKYWIRNTYIRVVANKYWPILIGMLWTERYTVTAMCGVQLKDRKRAKDLVMMLGWNEIIDQLAMANSAPRHGRVLSREDGHVMEWH